MNKFFYYTKRLYFLIKDSINGILTAMFAVMTLGWIGVTGLNCLLTMYEVPFNGSNKTVWVALFAFWSLIVYFIYNVFSNPEVKLKRWIAIFWLAGIVLPLIPGFRMFLDFD